MSILRWQNSRDGSEKPAATSFSANGKGFERSGRLFCHAREGLNKKSISAALKPLAYRLRHALRGFALHLRFFCSTEFVMVYKS
ncbi:MAG: hypothetical protein ACT4OY_03235 [Alphaproteobacteria bacterium]